MRTETWQSLILIVGLGLVTHGVYGWSPHLACVVLGSMLVAGVVWSRTKTGAGE